jgi:hypothetical protein
MTYFFILMQLIYKKLGRRSVYVVRACVYVYIYICVCVYIYIYLHYHMNNIVSVPPFHFGYRYNWLH